MMLVDDEHVGMALQRGTLQMGIVGRKAEVFMLDHLRIVGRPHRRAVATPPSVTAASTCAVADRPVEFPSHPATG